MGKISQKERYRQSLIRDAIKYCVAKAAARYAADRRYAYRRTKRYDGSLESLRETGRDVLTVIQTNILRKSSRLYGICRSITGTQGLPYFGLN